MVDKRRRKFTGLRADVKPPTFRGDSNPKILLVTWGSNWGAVWQAASTLRNQGQKVAVLHFSQIWPLVAENFLELLQKAKEVIMVEGNAGGQLAET